MVKGALNIFLCKFFFPGTPSDTKEVVLCSGDVDEEIFDGIQNSSGNFFYPFFYPAMVAEQMGSQDFHSGKIQNSFQNSGKYNKAVFLFPKL